MVIDEDETPSNFAGLKWDVAQRSVLGPLLFLWYINDIGNGFYHVLHLIYAYNLRVVYT